MRATRRMANKDVLSMPGRDCGVRALLTATIGARERERSLIDRQRERGLLDPEVIYAPGILLTPRRCIFLELLIMPAGRLINTMTE